MFLPLIMVERWGWPGFWVFAVPNVLGCAVMGYAIGSAKRSAAMTRSHAGAMRWFSVVTITFQIIFLSMIFGNTIILRGGHLGAIVVPAVAMIAALTLSHIRNTCALVLATLLTAFSIWVFAMVGTDFIDQVPMHGSSPLWHLWMVAPLITVGFLASPWLDGTFHYARQQTPSRHSFAVFAAAFFVMILGTLFYWNIEPPALPGLVLLYLIGQTIFTMAVHVQAIRRLAPDDPRGTSASAMLVIPMTTIAAAYVLWISQDHHVAKEFLEDTYLRFLAYYGLIVPLWVVMFIGPFGHRTVTRQRVAVVVGILVLSFPLAEIGMIGQVHWLLPAPIAVILAAGILMPRSPRAARATGA